MFKALSLSSLWLCFGVPYAVNAQDVRITNVDIQGGEVIIRYDLVDETVDRRYSLHLYSSQDNYIQPVQNVSGDIGVDIAVGGNKSVRWNAKEELGADFQGDIALELKGSIYIPFITFEGIEEGQQFKRGKSHDLAWSGGRGDNVLDFELYQGDNLVRAFDERPNVGNTTIIFPSDVKPGKNYRLRISDKRNKDEVIYTSSFVIKRKVALGIKVGLGLLVGGAVGVLVSSGSSSDSEAKIGEPPLPTR